MFLFLALVFVIGAAVFYFASSHSLDWASGLCSTAPAFCEHPWWLLGVAAVIVLLGLLRSAARGGG
jgi:hypothetical protein